MFPNHTKHIIIFCMIFLLKINFWTVESQPVAMCPSNKTDYIELGYEGTVIIWEKPTLLGSSEDVTLISQSHSNDTLFPPGVTEVMFTFTDALSGNNFSCSFFVEIIPIDTTPPVISNCSMDLYPCPPLGQPDIEVNFTEPTATDRSGSVSLESRSHKPGDVFTYGITLVTYVFSDPSGNAAVCTFYIVISHDCQPIPPTVHCISDISLEIPLGQFGTIVFWEEPVAYDNSGIVYLQHRTHAPYSFFPVGVTQVTYIFADNAGATASCSFNVTIKQVDDIPPSVNCIDDITITAPIGINAVPVDWEEPTTIDNSGEETIQMRSHDPGSTFPIGETTVVYNFLDSTGNAAQCIFNVLVLEAVDDVPPTVHCIDDITITVPNGTTSQSVVWMEPSATDNSGEEPLKISSHDPGFAFPIGETTVTYTFIDSAGNIAECMFKVNLSEEVISLPDCDGYSEGDSWEPIPCKECFCQEGSKICGSPSCYVPCFNPIPGEGACCPTCPGLNFDDVPPSVNCTDDVIETVPKGTPSQVVSWEEPTAYDNSGEEPIKERSHDPGSTFPIGETTVFYTFVDATGNTAECSFKVILLEEVDEAPRSVNCTDDIIITVPKGTPSQAVAWEEPTAYDNSGEEPIKIRSHDPGSTFSIGETTVTYTFVDATGNTVNCSFNVILLEEVDEVPPTVNCTEDIIETVPRGTSFHAVAWEEPTAYDNSGEEPTKTRSHDPGSRFPIGGSTVTYSFVDSSGNAANCTFKVTLLEAVGPVVTMCPSSKTVTTCNSESVVSWIPPKVLDDNSKVTTSSSHFPGDLFQIGESKVIYTFTNQSEDIIAQCSFIVVVEKQSENCQADSFIIYIVISVGVFFAVFLTISLMIFFFKLCHDVKYNLSSGKEKNNVQMLRVTRRGVV